MKRLIDEAETIVAAGSFTTAHFLKGAIYHLHANPTVLARVRAELQQVMPNPSVLPSTHQLERLPYLTAVVNETFRLTLGVSARLTRIAPDQDLESNGWIIPAGTPIGMTSVVQHNHPSIFPDPYVFNPDRFMGDGEKLTRYLTNFSRGTRMCLGMNLARAEIFMTLAALVGRFKMNLYETDRSDIDVYHDFFNPSAKLDSKGLRVTIQECVGVE